jgi:hypothetical protein
MKPLTYRGRSYSGHESLIQAAILAPAPVGIWRRIFTALRALLGAGR